MIYEYTGYEFIVFIDIWACEYKYTNTHVMLCWDMSIYGITQKISFSRTLNTSHRTNYYSMYIYGTATTNKQNCSKRMNMVTEWIMMTTAMLQNIHKYIVYWAGIKCEKENEEEKKPKQQQNNLTSFDHMYYSFTLIQ